MAHGMNLRYTTHLPGMLGRKRKIEALKKTRRATRVGHKRMAKAEAKEADEVAEDLAEAAAQKKFAKTYKKLKSRPLSDKIILPWGSNVDTMAFGDKARKKRVYSNESTKKLKIGPFKNF